MEGVVLYRVGILGFFFVLNRVRVSTLSGTPIPKHGSSTLPLGWGSEQFLTSQEINFFHVALPESKQSKKVSGLQKNSTLVISQRF